MRRRRAAEQLAQYKPKDVSVFNDVGRRAASKK